MAHSPEICDLLAAESNSDDAPLESVARAAYKYTDCGVSVGFLICAADGSESWVFDSLKLRQRGSLADMTSRGESVTGVCVGSIVEGVEECTETVELLGSEVAHYWDAIGQIESAAQHIWDATHGCETCAAHFEREGLSPIWPDCPDCGGDGICI